MQGLRNQEEFLKLKKYYEAERDKLEVQISEERDKKDRELKDLTKYYENRLKEETDAKEDELVQLKVEITRSRQLFKDSLSNAEAQAKVRYEKVSAEYMSCKI
jgi:hypothetical protein